MASAVHTDHLFKGQCSHGILEEFLIAAATANLVVATDTEVGERIRAQVFQPELFSKVQLLALRVAEGGVVKPRVAAIETEFAQRVCRDDAGPR